MRPWLEAVRGTRGFAQNNMTGGITQGVMMSRRDVMTLGRFAATGIVGKALTHTGQNAGKIAAN